VKGSSFEYTHLRQWWGPLVGRSRATAMEAAEPLEGPPGFGEVLCEVGTALAALLSIATCVNVISDAALLG
jgi:hypothetical protein